MNFLTEDEAKRRFTWRIAQEFNETEVPLFINLGVGAPTLVADHITNPLVFLQAENGMLGVGPAAPEDCRDCLLINAGRTPVTETPGCSFFDSGTSFGMIRGGHVDATVIGAFEVDQDCNVANWIIPNGKQLGVGGAMDLVAGARQVYIAMTHVTKKGSPKIIPACTLPVTGYGEVDAVVTEWALFRNQNGRLVLEELAPDISLEELKGITAAQFEVSPNLKAMPVPEEA